MISIVPLLMVGVLLWLIWKRTADVPYADEWATVAFARDLSTRSLTWNDLWQPINEHRIVVYKLISIAFIKLTHWNREVEMSFGVVMVLGMGALLLDCARRTTRSVYATMICVVPISLTLLSLRQYELWMTLFGVGWFPVGVGATICFWALIALPPSWRGLLLAMLGVLIASLTNAGGLAAWVTFLPVLWIAGYRQRRFFVTWIGAGILTIGIYLYHLSLARADRGSIVGIVRYALTLLGGLVGFPDVHRALILTVASMALVVIDLAVCWWLRADTKPLLLWIGFGLFPLALAGLTGVGRSATFGLELAMQPRYQSFSALWWVTVIVVTCLSVTRIVSAMQTSRGKESPGLGWGTAGTNALALLALCLVLLGMNRMDFQTAKAWPAGHRENVQCIVNYMAASDRCLQPYSPESDFVRASSSFLEAHRLMIFHDSQPIRTENLQRIPKFPLFSIETISTWHGGSGVSGPIVIPQGSAIPVTGWVVDSIAKLPGAAAFISVDDTRDTLAEYGQDRPDVAAAYKEPGYHNVGFRAFVSTTDLAPGPHALTIKVLAHDGKSYYTPFKIADIDVRPVSTLTQTSGTTLYAILVTGGVRSGGPGAETAAFTQVDPMIIDGWAVDSRAGMASRGVYLSVDGTMNSPLLNFYDRPAVSNKYNNPAYLVSGFYRWIFGNEIPVGKHTLTLKIVTADGLSYYVPPWRMEIEIRA